MKTSKDLQQELKARNSSLRDFASRRGYKYRTVCIVAQRWWHRNDRLPHGGLAKEILQKLRDEMESDCAGLIDEGGAKGGAIEGRELAG